MFQTRTHVLAVILALGIFILLGRLAQLQLVQSEQYRKESQSRRHRVVQVPPMRGRILDRRGEVLAIDLPSYDVWLVPARYARVNRKRTVIGTLGTLQPVQVVTLFHSTAPERQTLRQSALLSLREGSALVPLLAKLLKRTPNNIARAVLQSALHRHAAFPEALTVPRRVFRGISEAAFFALQQAQRNPETRELFNGIELRIGARREYPYGALMGHITGYTGMLTETDYRTLRGYWRGDEEIKGTGQLRYRGRAVLTISPTSDEAKILRLRRFYRHGQMRHFAGYFVTETMGRGGVELYYNERLRGHHRRKRLRLERPDPKGPRKLVDQEKHRTRIRGQDVRLTIDVRFQKKVVNILKRKTAELAREHPDWLSLKKDGGAFQASALLLEPNTGRIIALASLPEFNPNTFRKNYAQLKRNPSFSLTSPVLAGEYPPGSVIKPVVGLHALYRGAIKPRSSFVCAGFLSLENRRTGQVREFVCMGRHAHGTVSIVEGLMRSCNVFFYHVGQELGSRGVYNSFARLGMGRTTGIDIAGEAAGKLPNAARTRKGWSLGQTYHLAIGQGPITVTPLQVGVAFSAIANGGYIVRPHVLLDAQNPLLDQPRGEVAVSEEALRAIRRGMFEVVQGDHGTAKGARIPGIQVAGKTGSAQWRSGLSKNTHAWFAAYAPFDNPKIVCVVLIPRGGGGGSTAAPIARELLELYFEFYHGIRPVEEGVVG